LEYASKCKSYECEISTLKQKEKDEQAKLEKQILTFLNSTSLFKQELNILASSVEKTRLLLDSQRVHSNEAISNYRFSSERQFEAISVFSQQCSSYRQIIEQLKSQAQYELYQMNRTLSLANRQLEKSKEDQSRLEDENHLLSIKLTQVMGQCKISAEDNEELLKSIEILKRELLEYSFASEKVRSLEEQSVNLEKITCDQIAEIEKLKEENERLIQHQNMKQKLQYHVKIKQENNELREMLRICKEENAILHQKIKNGE
jgi:kinesin family protein 15